MIKPCVITSYSIHYTKLYALADFGVPDSSYDRIAEMAPDGTVNGTAFSLPFSLRAHPTLSATMIRRIRNHFV